MALNPTLSAQALRGIPRVSATAAWYPIAPQDPDALAADLLQAWRAGRIPLLGASVAGRASPCRDDAAREGDAAHYVAFSTSGSNGQPKAVVKDFQELAAEARYLAILLGLTKEQSVSSLVPAHHIYGFLFGFLMPHLQGCHSRWWPSASLPSIAAHDAPRTILIAVPSMWSAIEALQSAAPMAKICVSGSPLGADCQERWRQATASPTLLFEFLGSTETGGFAYRSWPQCAEASCHIPFTLFDGAALQEHDGTWYLRSPFRSEVRQEITLADRFHPVNERQFHHAGRDDGVFKFNGQRFSRREIEARLTNLYGGGLWKCFFAEDANHRKGGHLDLFVAGLTPESLHGLRRQLSVLGLPIPERIFVAPTPPLDAMGKLTLPVVQSFSTLLHDT